MSIREDERQKNCSSRGLGIAAAAIGVGVGAALYYFFSKREEHPGDAGSTSGWGCEETHALAEARLASLREDNFRQRAYSVEECSICFDTMTPQQEVMSLACTHRFHQACIMPWLQEQQTCPMCRKAA